MCLKWFKQRLLMRDFDVAIQHVYNYILMHWLLEMTQQVYNELERYRIAKITQIVSEYRQKGLLLTQKTIDELHLENE